MKKDKNIKVGITMNAETLRKLEEQAALLGLKKSQYIQLLVNSGVCETLLNEERKNYLLKK